MISEIAQPDMVETVDDPGLVLDATDPGKPLVENICCLDLVFHDDIVAHRRHTVKGGKTFCGSEGHAGAAYSGKTEYMHQDEGFVDLVGSLFHQAVIPLRFQDGTNPRPVGQLPGC